MKLLTAAVDGDPAGWSWCIPGELVFAANLCDLDGDPNHASDHDCRFSFVGMVSGYATTCAQVAELDHTREQLLEAVRDFWDGPAEDEELEAEVDSLLADAAPYDVGTFLHRRDDELLPI